MNKVKQLVERLLDEALCFTLIHCHKVKGEVRELTIRKHGFSGRIIKLVRAFPVLNSHTCILEIGSRSKGLVVHQLVESHDRLLNILQHAVLLRAIDIAVCSCKDGTLRLCRHSVKHLLQTFTSTLEDAAIHDTLQVVGSLSSKITIAIKRTCVLCI